MGYKKKEGKDGFTNIFGVNITVPENSYLVEFDATRGELPPVDPKGFASLTLTMRRERLKLKPDKKVRPRCYVNILHAIVLSKDTVTLCNISHLKKEVRLYA